MGAVELFRWDKCPKKTVTSATMVLLRALPIFLFHEQVKIGLVGTINEFIYFFYLGCGHALE